MRLVASPPGGVRAWMAALACLAACVAASAVAAPRERVDVELVFAVDVSASMDEDEHALQRRGYADALRHAEVIDAIRMGTEGRIAVTYLEWAGSYPPRQIIPWTVIASAADARKVASMLEEAPAYSERLTSISTALLTAADLIDRNRFDGARKVIDISGDGPNNAGESVTAARDAVVARGMTINGLPINLGKPLRWYDIPDIEAYYRRCVIGGPNAFLVPLRRLDRMTDIIRRKMVMEIADLSPPARPGTSGVVPAAYAAGDVSGRDGEDGGGLLQLAQLKRPETYDCLIGEKVWMRRFGNDQGDFDLVFPDGVPDDLITGQGRR